MPRSPARPAAAPAAVPSVPRLSLTTAVALATLAVGASPRLAAQVPPGYYNSVNTSSPASLLASLHAVIDDHTRFPYTASATDTWNILEQADENPANSANIVDLYGNNSYVKIGGGVGAYDREHSWPKSYGFPDDLPDNYPYTDCHQLFLCDSGYNSSRGNRPYSFADALASERPTVLTNGSGGGSGSYPGNSNWTDSAGAAGRWEAWRDRRGDVARAQFYMDVRYEGGTHGVTGANEPNLILTDNATLIAASNTGSNAATGYMGILTTLLQWHLLDPVDQRERDRNDLVYSYQGNRNPFVDHPEWVACLFQSGCADTVPPAAPLRATVTVGKATVALDWPDNGENDLAGYRVFRAAAPGGPFVQLNTTLVAASAYVDVFQARTPVYYVVRAVDVSGNVSAASGAAIAAWPRPIVAAPFFEPAGAWINEVHYDNTGGDAGEFVEVAGAAGTNLAGWTLLAYNGNGGAVYSTIPLSGTLPSQQGGFGALAFNVPGLQNGAPDGIALVNAQGVLVEFLAYEGTFVAVGGAANGQAAVAIPTAEGDTTPVGFSLQRQGTGRAPAAFTWSAPIAATPGQPNTGQTLQ